MSEYREHNVKVPIKNIEIFKKRLNEIHDTNLTGAEFAQQLNISESTLSKYLPDKHGRPSESKRSPSYDMLYYLAKYYNVSPDYLMGFYEDDNFDLAIIMRNFLIAADKLGIELTFSDEMDSFYTYSNEPKLVRALHTAMSNRNFASDDESRVVLINSELISETDCEEFRKNLYLYGHLLDLDEIDEADYHFYRIQYFVNLLEKAKKNCSEDDFELQEKLVEWEKGAEKPISNPPDIYRWFFRHENIVKSQEKIIDDEKKKEKGQKEARSHVEEKIKAQTKRNQKGSREREKEGKMQIKLDEEARLE